MNDSEIQFSHSPVLFCDDVGRGLHFLLKTDSDKEALVMMIKHGGGIILTEPSDYSITLVSPDYDFDETFDDVYSIQYIEDCCTQNKILHLMPYRLNTKSLYPDDFDVMDAFLKLTTWDNARLGIPFTRNYYQYYSSDSTSDIGYSDDSFEGSYRSTSPVSSGKSSPVPSESSYCDSMEAELDAEMQARSNQRHNSPDPSESSYCDSIQAELEAELAAPNQPHKKVRRSSHLPDPSENNCCDSIQEVLDAELAAPNQPLKKVQRSSQCDSLFVNVPDSPENSICDLSEVSTSSTSKQSPNQKQTSSIAGSPSSNCSKIIETKESDPDDDKSHSSKNKRNDEALLVSENAVSSTNTITSTKTKENNLLWIESSDSDDSDITPSANQNNVRKRKEYTEEERKLIVEFISRQKAHSYVKGREFWMKMVAKKVIPGRSWQSLKEHFCKQIVPRIDKYNLKEEEVAKFKKPFL